MQGAVGFAERAGHILLSARFWRGTLATAVCLLVWETGARGPRARTGAELRGGNVQRPDARSELLVQLVPEHAACFRRLFRRHAGWHSTRARHGGEPDPVRHRVSSFRGAATDPAAGVGPGRNHLLADAGVVDRI